MPPFPAGNNANPRGRPKKVESLTELIRAALRTKGPDGILYRRKIAGVLVEKAAAGDLDAIKIVLDRTDGKVTTPLDVTSAGGPLPPLTVVFPEVPDRDGS